jgi:hypothetical protein
VLGELSQASRDLYDDSAHSDTDGGDRQNNGGATFGARSGVKTN